MGYRERQSYVTVPSPFGVSATSRPSEPTRIPPGTVTVTRTESALSDG